MRGFRTKKLWHRFLKKKSFFLQAFSTMYNGLESCNVQENFLYLFEIGVEEIDSVR